MAHSHAALVDLNAAIAELRRLERDVANRPLLVDNRQLHDPAIVELRARVQSLRARYRTALEADGAAAIARYERQLAEMQPAVDKARALLREDPLGKSAAIAAAHRTVNGQTGVIHMLGGARALVAGAADAANAL